jgi:hypothetical protein
MKNESFHNTITNSPEWEAWCKEQRRSWLPFECKVDGKFPDVFDVDESQECDLLSQKHWRAFIKFLTNK